MARKKHDCADLAIIEMKFRDGSLNSTTQSAGLVDHVIRLRDAVDQGRVSFDDLAEEMRIVFNQRVNLGLVECHSEKGKIAKDLTCISGQHPQFILLLADHDPDSGTLQNELTTLLKIEQSGNLPFDLRIATANFMGYGLYDESIYPLSDFIERFADHIYSRGKGSGEPVDLVLPRDETVGRFEELVETISLDSREQPLPVCEWCKQRPATERRLDTWTANSGNPQYHSFCAECSGRIMF